jgi:hypothetical protein
MWTKSHTLNKKNKTCHAWIYDSYFEWEIGIWVVKLGSTLFINTFVIGSFGVVAEVAKLDLKWIPTWSEDARGKKLVIEWYGKKSACFMGTPH